MSEIVRFSVVDTVNAKRAMGVNDEQIAYVLNMSKAQVSAIPYPKPNPVKARAVQHMQLRKMMQVLMPKVEQGDQNAMLTLLKVMNREAALLGLDAPKETITHNFNKMDADFKNLTIDQLKKMALEYMEQSTIDITPTAPESTGESAP